MKLTYSVVPQKTMSARQRFTYLIWCRVLTFYKKDGEDTWRQWMLILRIGRGCPCRWLWNGSPASLHRYRGKVPESVIWKRKNGRWKALQYIWCSLMDKINFLAMLGDTNRFWKNMTRQRSAIIRLYGIHANGIEMTKAMIQMRIKQKLAALDLIK